MGALNTPQILFGKVMHKRLIPKVNGFTYPIYYWTVPLSKLGGLKQRWWAKIDIKTHGPKDGSAIEPWAREILKNYGLDDKADGEIILIAMPKILGYVFNPVSFWLCLDKAGELRAVICEVRNTFGQHHDYLCAFEDGRVINKDDVMEAEKLFHVSPFLEREGHYRFRFDVSDERFGAWIDLHNANGEKQLLTALSGTFKEMNPQTRRKAFWRFFAMPQQAISLIHWQALKIISKGISYVRLPKQHDPKFSAVKNLSSRKEK